jgi:hypothetical protein
MVIDGAVTVTATCCAWPLGTLYPDGWVRVRVVEPAVSGLKLNWVPVLVASAEMVAGLPSTVPTAVLELPNDTETGAAWGPRVPGVAKVRVPEFNTARATFTVVFVLKLVVLIVGEVRYRPDGSKVNVTVAFE